LNAGKDDIENIFTCQDQLETVPKNQHSHSAAGEESHIFLFKSKIRRGDPSAYSLRMTGKVSLREFCKQP